MHATRANKSEARQLGELWTTTQMHGRESDEGSCGRDSFSTRSMVEADEGEKGKKGEPPLKFE